MAPVSSKKKPVKSAKSAAQAARGKKPVRRAKAVAKTAVKVAKKTASKVAARAKLPASPAKIESPRRTRPERPHQQSAWKVWKQIGRKFLGFRNLWAFAFMFSSFGLVAVIVKLRPETPAPGQQIARVTPHSAHAPAVAAPPVAVAPAADTGPLAAEFAALRGKDLGERVAFWSEFLTHKSKAQRALALIGDAPAIEDTAPLLPGKYDCTTFVETVAALSRSDRSEEFYPNLLSIRYRDGKPTYLSRNHFPEADWIPNNKRIGVLRDITDSVAEVAKVDHQIARKTIDRAKWLAKQETQGKVSRGLASVSDREIQQASVPFIPLEAVSAAEARIPNGAILNIVRQDRANKPVLITHQGFVVQRDGKTWFRHASVGGSIKTVLLSEYLRELEEKAREKNWPLAGINLNELGRSGRF